MLQDVQITSAAACQQLLLQQCVLGSVELKNCRVDFDVKRFFWLGRKQKNIQKVFSVWSSASDIMSAVQAKVDRWPTLDTAGEIVEGISILTGFSSWEGNRRISRKYLLHGWVRLILCLWSKRRSIGGQLWIQQEKWSRGFRHYAEFLVGKETEEYPESIFCVVGCV